MLDNASHEPAPIYLFADNCDHPEPDDSESRAWSDWEADHTESRDTGERICTLTPIGSFCPACTDYARKEFELAPDGFIDAGDCVHAPVLP